MEAPAHANAKIEALPRGLLAALGEARAYPSDDSALSGVSRIQTHVSHLFLSARRVYKLRKAVRLPFLSFATRAERNADCAREVILNRRLAPDVYLGVAPVRAGAARAFAVGRLQTRVDEEALRAARDEHCVVMRRLSSDRDALSLLQRGRLEPRHVDAIADRVAEFHARVGLETPVPTTGETWLARVGQRRSSGDAAGPPCRRRRGRTGARRRAPSDRRAARRRPR